ncbi:hypothetical protein EON81_22865 [bacterium]|nr:MAG: hypothetical protein EON81_22865 [bacterium]
MNEPTIDPLVWSRAGGDPLTAIYGYVPSLHDARLVAVELAGRDATLRFEYLDQAEGAARPLRTRFEFVFSGVSRFRMPLDETYVLDAALAPAGKGLRLDLTMPGGWALLEADGMEIRLLAVDLQNEPTPPTLDWKP